MDARPLAAAIALLQIAAMALASGASAAEPSSIAAEPLPPPSSAAAPPPSPSPSPVAPPLQAPATRPETSPREAAAPADAAAPAAPPGRVFCEQPVSAQIADPDSVAERYRPFIGVWSDAAWSPTLCAALIVNNVTADGTAAITYVFGPMAANARGAGGILHGTGIIRDGELKFQNSDGSQFAFRPFYADLDGQLTTPQGQRYQAVFKKAP